LNIALFAKLSLSIFINVFIALADVLSICPDASSNVTGIIAIFLNIVTELNVFSGITAIIGLGLKSYSDTLTALGVNADIFAAVSI